MIRVDSTDLDALAFEWGSKRYIAVSKALRLWRLEAAVARELCKLLSGMNGIMINPDTIRGG